MRLEAGAMENFRCYRDEVVLRLGDLTTFMGKNNIGRLSALEALEIRFNNETVEIEQGDANIYSGDTQISTVTEPVALVECQPDPASASVLSRHTLEQLWQTES